MVETLIDFIRFGGIAGLPLLILAPVTFWHSLRYLLDPRSHHLLVGSAAAGVGLLLALLSTVLDFMISVGYLQGHSDWVLILMGLAEALGAVVLALLTCLLATTLLSIGGWRLLRASRTQDMGG